MWVKVEVEVTNYVPTVHPGDRSNLVGTRFSTEEHVLTGPVWARSEDLPPVTPKAITPVSAYKRTVEVSTGDGVVIEQVFRLFGAWSPKPGQLIADKWEALAAAVR